MDGVDTFTGGLHDGDFMHTVALFSMRNNGIEVVGGVDPKTEEV